MGVRHKIYIISNVLGRYRVVAVYHLQWLEPPDAVHLAWILLQHVKQHAEPLEKELRCLQERRYIKNGAEYPCPFLGALLFQRVQDFDGPDQFTCPESVVDNDPWMQGGEFSKNGFTVIDVTNPFSPAYCFWGPRNDYGFTPGYPIDPEDYALRYWVDPGDERIFEDLEQEVQDAILAIQSEPSINDDHILDEAWDNSSPTLEDITEVAPPREGEEFMKDLRNVIEAGSAENAQNMADGLVSTSGVADGLRRTLRRRRLPKYCDPVLIRAFIITQDISKSSELDLSWMQLLSAQVLKVVQAVLQDDSFKITSLDLSGNPDVTLATLSNLFRLDKAREIKRLFLFGCPKVEDVKRADMPGRIGMAEGAEVFNSYFPADLSEFRPWIIKPRSGKSRPRV